METKITTSIDDFWKCERCNINNLTHKRMIPCPRGGCEAEIVGEIKTTKKIEIVLKT